MSGRASALLAGLLLIGSLILFLDRAAVNGQRVNTDLEATDQGAYLKQAILLRLTDFAYFNPRNRMPLYPGLLALCLDKEQLIALQAATPDRKEFYSRATAALFEKGKRLNTYLAVAILVFLAAVFFWKFPCHHAANIWLLTAFLVFLFKAPYVQAELLYYFLTFAAFLVCWRLFEKPSPLGAILAGLLLGLAHLTKASVLPGVLVMAVFYPLDAIWLRRKIGRPLWRRLAIALLLVLSFLAVIFPYIAQSKATFGQYFYNVNSTFYFWCDSWKEAKSRTGDAGDRKGWPDLPADQLPGFSNYLKTHSATDVGGRVAKGLSVVLSSMRKSYGYLWLCLAYLLAAVAAVAWKWRLVWRLIGRRPVPLLALGAYFFGYYLLVAWYSPIINGNRFILGLFLPFLFAVSVVLVRLAPRVRGIWRGWRWNGLTIFNGVMSVWIAAQIAVVCASRITWMYGGG